MYCLIGVDEQMKWESLCVGSAIVMLSAAFAFSFPFSGFSFDCSHIVYILLDNPSRCAEFTSEVLLYEILPIVASFFLFAIPCLGSQHLERWFFSRRVLLLLGIFCALWGLLHLWASYSAYSETVELAAGFHAGHLINCLFAIYAFEMLAYAVWILAGIMLAIKCHLKS
jgi:hypothetical protein